MAFASSFPENNEVLAPIRGCDDCQPQAVWRGDDPANPSYHAIISCFKFTPEEFNEIKQTGRIWMICSENGTLKLTGHNPFSSDPKLKNDTHPHQ